MDPRQLVESFGTIGVVAIVFAESGLLVGFFLPGDSLLVTAGLLASQHRLSYPVLLIGCGLAAIAGDQTGYLIGKRIGTGLFRRPDARVFRPSHVRRAQRFFDRFGPKTIVLARFVPVVRTFVPVLAGVVVMRYRTFVIYNVIGGLAWGCGVLSLGYVLGRSVAHVDRYLLPLIGVVVIASFVPVIVEIVRDRRAARDASVTVDEGSKS